MYYGTQQTLQSGVCVGHDLHYGTQQRWQSCVCVLDMTCTITMATDVAQLCALHDTTRAMVHYGRVSWTRKTDLYDGVRLEFRQLHLDVVQLLLTQDPAGRPSPHSRGGGLHPLLDARDTAT